MYILYHQYKPGSDCPDGICAAWVASKALTDAKIVGWAYQSPPPDFLQPGDTVTCVDFSFPAAVLNRWQEQGIEVEIIDHHDTALDDLKGLSDRIMLKFDLNECGATLAWKHFFPNKPMPVFLEYVRDRDLWNWELEDTYSVHEAMGALGRKFALFDRLAVMSREELLWFLLPIGEPLAAPKQKLVREVADRFEWGEVAGYKVPLVKLQPVEDRLVSEVCTVLYKRFPNAPFTACLMSDGVSYELRSDKKGNNTDVSAIAKSHGGGGHRNASGFTTKLSQVVQ